MPKIKDKRHYINNKEFLAEMVKSHEQNELTPRAAKLMMKLAKRIAETKYYYVVEEDKDTCMSSGIEDCIRYWRNFKPDVSDNPFSYFTMTILNGRKKQYNKMYPKKAGIRISLSNNTIHSF